MKVIVGKHRITLEKEPVNEKQINVTKCYFEFENIPNNYVKEAYFTFDNHSYKQIIANNECDIPYEVLNKKGQVQLGVVCYLVENNETIIRYNPSPVYFETWYGSLKENAENTKPITPTDKEQVEQMLENINIQATKVDNTATISITNTDGQTHEVEIYDGEKGDKGDKGDKGEQGIQGPQGVQGIQGPIGPQGNPFTIKKTYSTIQAMINDYDNMSVGDYVMIDGNVEQQDNATLWVKEEQEDPTYRWHYLADFSGATGIQGPQGEQGPQGIQGIQGIQGVQGETGATGNGISSVTKTSTSGLVDTYTILFTNGNSTTFDVTNGNGIESIVKTSTSGNVDTYTITFTNGNTTTYDVTNSNIVNNYTDDGTIGYSSEYLNKELDTLRTIWNAFPTTSDEDTSITLNDTAECTFKKLDLKGNTSQISYTGKNLFNLNDTSYDKTSTYTTSGNAISVSNSSSSSNGYIWWNIPVQVGEQYTISYSEMVETTTSNNNRVHYLFVNEPKTSYGDGLGSDYINKDNKQITLSATDNYLVVALRISNGNSYTISDIQVEKSSTKTDYEPYVGGTPSPNPSYPQPIQVVSGDNTIVSTGKNLFEDEYIGIPMAGRTNAYLIAGTYTLASCDSNTFGKNIYFILFDKNTKNIITSSGHLTSSQVSSFSTSSYRYYGGAGASAITFTLDNDYYVNIGLLDSDGTRQVMLVKGSEAIRTYQPYTGNTYPIYLGDIELCKIGDYQDYFLKENDKWYLHKEIGKYVFTSCVSTSENVTGETSYYSYLGDISTMLTANWGNGFSNQFVKGTTKANNVIRLGVNNKNVYIYTNDTNFANKTSADAWLTNNNVIIYYQLQTPTNTLIEDTTLIEQLEALKLANSYEGQTNISQVNNDLGFILDVEAIKKVVS